jgi:hypothetical protein
MTDNHRLVESDGSELLRCFSEEEAIGYLAERGIKWARLVVDVSRSMDRHGRVIEQEGIHHYFMRGNSDVAYVTPALNSMRIHATPRPWAEYGYYRVKTLRENL